MLISIKSKTTLVFFFKSDMMVVNMALGGGSVGSPPPPRVYLWALPLPPFFCGGLLLPLGSMDWLIICPWVIKSKLKSFISLKNSLTCLTTTYLLYNSLQLEAYILIVHCLLFYKSIFF